MNNWLPGVACGIFLAVGAGASAADADTSAAAPASGIDLQYVDPGVPAKDDFYRHVNGKWLATVEIPPDKGSYGSFDKLVDLSLDRVRGIVEGLGNAPATSDPEQRKVADLYAAFMDEPTLNALGAKPLDPEFARIAALRDTRGLPALIAHLTRIGVEMPFDVQVHQDARDSTRYIVDLGQGGLGLPDRDYYLQDDAKLKQAREQYLSLIHI